MQNSHQRNGVQAPGSASIPPYESALPALKWLILGEFILQIVGKEEKVIQKDRFFIYYCFSESGYKMSLFIQETNGDSIWTIVFWVIVCVSFPSVCLYLIWLLVKKKKFFSFSLCVKFQVSKVSKSLEVLELKFIVTIGNVANPFTSDLDLFTNMTCKLVAISNLKVWYYFMKQECYKFS